MHGCAKDTPAVWILLGRTVVNRAATSLDQTREVDAVVFALVPEYHQVKVRDPEGRVYALTPKTEGVRLADLREGQRVVCTVTRRLPRVLRATIT
jgi:hypothetical protein